MHLNRKHSWILIGLLTLVCQATGAITSGNARLVEIRFTGSKRYPEAEIARTFGMKIGSDVSPDSFVEVANKLAATGLFASVKYKYRPTAAGMAVEFQVSDTTNFIPCRFDNFVWFSADTLQKELRARVPLYLDDVPPGGNSMDQITAALEALLKERGIQGTVIHRGSALPGGPVRAIVFIAEGVSIPIARVDFQGASRVDSAVLHAAVVPLLGTNYSGLFVSDFADYNLSPIYHKLGYLRVGFGDPTVDLGPNGAPKDSVAVTIPIHEGLQYRLKDIEWSGNTVFPSDELRKDIHLKVGEPADGVQFQEDLKGIQSLYGRRGYITAQTTPKADFQDETQAVNFRVEIREGDLYRMGKFEVSGIDASLAETLQKLFRPRTGEPFDAGFEKPYFDQIVHYLPRNLLAGKVMFRTALNEGDKTVDVTLTFAPKSGP